MLILRHFPLAKYAQESTSIFHVQFADEFVYACAYAYILHKPEPDFNFI